MRIVNLSGEITWTTIAYIPVIPTLSETAGAERARLRRSAILQRMLYLTLRSAIGASHSGVHIYDAQNKRTLTAFPRVLAYICDQPEERAVLCLKAGQCQQPCTSCSVQRDLAGAASAATAADRDAIEMLGKQWEATAHRTLAVKRARRLHLEATSSINSFMPALACMAGLSTAPHLMYKMTGFDTLHVRLLPTLVVSLFVFGLAMCACPSAVGGAGVSTDPHVLLCVCPSLQRILSSVSYVVRSSTRESLD